MARGVDAEVKRTGASIGVTVAMARNYVTNMGDKSAELQAANSRLIGGHPRGEQLVQELERAVDVLAAATTSLSMAAEAIHGIDVTKEVDGLADRY